MDAVKPRFGVLQIGIVILALATALIHFFLATLGPAMFTILFILNGLGYIVLTIAIFLPQLARYNSLIHWLFIGFTAITILAYFAMNGTNVSTIGMLTKLIEVGLIVLLFLDNRH